MKLAILGVAVLAATAPGALEGAEAASQAPTVPGSPQLAEGLREYARASQPGAEHRHLDPLAGLWRMEVSWSDADGKRLRVAGESVNRWILGGRFLLCEAKAEAEDVPIETLTVYGFDTRRQRFFALGLNNLGTDYVEASGTFEPASRSFVLSYKQRKQGKGLLVSYRMLLRIEGPDRYTLELFVDWPGKRPQRVMETIYARQGP